VNQVWQRLKEQHPDVLDLVSNVRFPDINGIKHLLAASLGVLATQPSQTPCGNRTNPYSLRSHDG
jgi:hypothetical protein